MSRYQANPDEEYWIAVKNILKYLRRTKNLFLIFGEGSELRVGGYTDTYNRISTSECVLEQCWFGMLEGFQAIDQ